MSKKMPVFKDDKEAAEFWDKTDAAEYLEDGNIEEFAWESTRDRCNYCGSKMKRKRSDITIRDGKVVIHGITRYRCPHCNRERFDDEFKKELPLIAKALVEVAMK
jgi:YgiT-type zinc finger domain-containing protein